MGSTADPSGCSRGRSIYVAEHCLGGVTRKCNGSSGAKGQVSADGQPGDAVDQRPGRPGKRQRVARGEITGLLRGGDAVEQEAEGIFAEGVDFPGALTLGDGQVEHDQQVMRPAQGEINIAAAAQHQSFAGRTCGRHRLLHHGGEAVESLGCHCHKELIPAGKVAIGGIVGDAGAAGDFAERESAGAGLADEGGGGLKQGLAEVGVVVGADLGHEKILTENVDKSNI